MDVQIVDYEVYNINCCIYKYAFILLYCLELVILLFFNALQKF